MARQNLLRPSVRSGELSPRTIARVDLQQYPLGAETLENFLILPEGGFMRRPGTRFVIEVKDSAAKTNLMRFRFNTEQAYVLETGDQYFRFFRNQGRIVVPNTDAAITNGDFPAGITDWDDRSTGTGAISHDAVNGRLNLDGASASIAWAEQDVAVTTTGIEHVLRFRVLGIAGDTVQVRIGTATLGEQIKADQDYGVGWHAVAFTPNVSTFFVQFRNSAIKTIQIDDVSLLDDAQMEITTPYTTAELFELRSAQVADIRYICHTGHAVHKLLRFGHTSWSLEEADFFDGPYLDANTSDITATTLTPSAATGLGITITASAITGINGNTGFQATDVGRLVRIKHTNWGYARITGVTSTLIVTADVKVDFGAATASVDWALGAWSDTTGHPQSVAFFQSRSAYIRSTDSPQTIWLSQSNDFENMRPDNGTSAVEDDDAIARTLASNEVDTMLWIKSGPFLVVGTAGAEWIVRSSLDDEVLTPASFNAKPQTTKKAAPVDALQIDEATLFMQAGGRKLMQFGFNAEIRGWNALDLTRIAEHATKSGITALEYEEEPFSLVWALRTDGQAAIMSYRLEDEFAGWTRYRFGGAFGAGDAVAEAVVTIPGNAANGSEERDEVWLIVKRTINGGTVRYVEFLEKPHGDGDDQEDAFYVDSGLTYDGTPVSVITGLTHLEGEPLNILADGAIHPTRTVASGQITLDKAYSVVQAGLSYTSTYKSLKPEGGATIGAALTQTKRIGDVGLVLDNTLGISIGPDSANLTDIPFREVGDPMDTAVPLFTGEKIIEDFKGDWSTDPRIVIQSSAPAPATILALVPKVETHDSV